MGRDKFGSSVLLRWLSRVGPFERVCHRGVVVGHECSKLRFEVVHRSEVSASQTLSMNDTEYDLNLIEPRAVFRKVDKSDSMVEIGQELLPCGHGFQDTANAFFPSSSSRPH